MRKNTWYAVYHQQELEYLARSYQPGYFFIFMRGKPLTEYLRVDGLNKMLADLDMGGHEIVDIGDYLRFGTGRAILKSHDADRLMVRNEADTGYKNLRINDLEVVSSLIGMVTTTYIQTYGTNTGEIRFRSYLDGYTVDIILKGGCASILRAGDITGLAGKTLNFPTVIGINISSPLFSCQERVRFDPLGAEPAIPTIGDLCCADPFAWDPLGRGAGVPPYLVFWDGAAWKAVSSA